MSLKLPGNEAFREFGKTDERVNDFESINIMLVVVIAD